MTTPDTELKHQLYDSAESAPAQSTSFLGDGRLEAGPQIPPGGFQPAANIDAVLPGQLFRTPEAEHRSAVEFIRRDERAPLLTQHQINAVADVVQPLMTAMGIDSRHHEVLHRAIVQGPSATPEQREAWRREAETRLHGQYGDRWQDVRDLARRWVARDHQVAEWLTATGAGDHPDLVEAVAEIAWRMRLQGRHE